MKKILVNACHNEEKRIAIIEDGKIIDLDIDCLEKAIFSYKNLNKKFNDLVKTWTETSEEILLMMNKEHKVLTENKNPKSLLALGAMGAHINMALIALKATESDQ